MDNNSQLPPSNGEPVEALTQSAELDAYFAALQEQFATNADAPVGAALAEFVDVIDLVPIPQPAVSSPTTSRRPKMLTGIGAFIATTTGKIVLGTTVAAASVGGMHAAEIVDVPLLPEPAPAEVLMVDDEDDAEIEATDSTPGEDAELAAEVDDAVEPAEDADTDAVADDMDDADSDEADEEPKNHGAVVSDFAKNTELEGCEKGQAIAALAKSKDKKNDDGEDESDDDTDEVSTSDEDADAEEEVASKCASDSDDEEDEDSDEDTDDDDQDSDEDADDEDGDGPPEGKGNNRDDHPGKGKSQADSDE